MSAADAILRALAAVLRDAHVVDRPLAIDAVFRELEVVVFPAATRPHVRGADYLALVERSTYGDDRVRIT